MSCQDWIVYLTCQVWPHGPPQSALLRWFRFCIGSWQNGGEEGCPGERRGRWLIRTCPPVGSFARRRRLKWPEDPIVGISWFRTCSETRYMKGLSLASDILPAFFFFYYLAVNLEISLCRSRACAVPTDKVQIRKHLFDYVKGKTKGMSLYLLDTVHQLLTLVEFGIKIGWINRQFRRIKWDFKRIDDINLAPWLLCKDGTANVHYDHSSISKNPTWMCAF